MRFVVILVVLLAFSVCTPQMIVGIQEETAQPSMRDSSNNILGFPAGWSNDSALTVPDWNSNFPEIAINGGSIHLIYFNSSNGESYYKRSIDGGRTWDKIEMITGPDDVYSSWAPDVAVEGSVVHAVWADTKLQFPITEIFYRQSRDNGVTWESDFNLSISDGSLSDRPSIGVSDSIIHVVWDDERNGDLEIYYKRSTDGGTTWDDGLGNVGQDRRLTFYPGKNDVCPYVAVNGSYVHLIWSRRTADFDVWETMYMNSSNNGQNWSSQVMLSEHDTWHSDAQAIAVNKTGGLHVVLWEHKYGNQEVGYRNSTDNGITWNPEVRLTYDSNHSQQPDVGVNDSHVFVSWIDDRDHYNWTGAISGAFELYCIESFDGGTTWGQETRLTYAVNNSFLPAVAMDADYIHVAWTDNRTNGSRKQIFYKRSPDFPADPTYNITLTEGWNLISAPLIQNDESIGQVLQNIEGKWDYIQAYDALDPDHWKTNATFKPDQLNDLKTLNHKMGFWINITEPGVNLTVSGRIPTSTSIPLYAGWNLVGYPSLNSDTVANAFWGTGADSVMVCNTSEPYNIQEAGPEYVMRPGEGYWVHVVADSIWTVDW